MHWINAAAVIIMIMSGLRIYNATQFLGFKIPDWMTLGGWLGGALQWHFAFMWLLGINAVLYLAFNIFTRRLWTKFFPLSLKSIFVDLWAALRGRLSHQDIRHYNAVQKVAYLFVMLDIALLICSGLVLWKSVQFPILRTLLGGYEAARYIHFFAMGALVAFIVVHLIMVLVAPRTLLAMLRGK
jgi:thiosulfate reductase cytochrome b subunit